MCINEQGKHNGHGYNSNGGDANQPHTPSTHRRDMSKVVCFNCKRPGHYARDCTEPASGNGYSGEKKPDLFEREHVNHVNVRKSGRKRCDHVERGYVNYVNVGSIYKASDSESGKILIKSQYCGHSLQ
jgi:hypothetical protein